MKKIWKRKWFWPLVVILVAVLIVRLMLAIWVRDYVNRKLVDVVFDRVQMVGTNFTNSKKLSKTLVAEIDMEGRPLRTANARCNVRSSIRRTTAITRSISSGRESSAG